MQDDGSVPSILLELKQKEFLNILFELPKGLTIDKFFQMTKEIGLAGEGVHFVLISLDFRGESLPDLGPSHQSVPRSSASKMAQMMSEMATPRPSNDEEETTTEKMADNSRSGNSV